MKILRYTYIIALAALTAVMAACSSDSIEPDQPNQNGSKDLTLRISTEMTTRARTTNWDDTNAQDEEMMNLWVVVVTNTTGGAVQKFFACRPSAGSEREIDDVARITQGAYTIYSFANISIGDVCDLLGIGITTMTDIGNTPTEFETTGNVNHSAVAAKVTTVNGNGFDPTAADNGFGETGIPMSNVQTTTATDSSKDLIVVRMLAKMKVSVQNQTGAAQYIKYASITSITDNVDNNLKLLPSYTTASSADKMDAVHGDIQPNLNGTPATVELDIPGMATTEALANNATREVTFYVNECAIGSDFNLTIGLGDASSTQEYRYALINQKGATTADDDKWDYIARNDYRIIPIVLDDYKLELIPYDFPPIGVYPVSVSEVDTENHIYNFTFHDYGHFHLLPKVTKISDNTTVAYSATAPSGTAWTLNSDFAGSWKTAATKGGAWLSAEQITSNGFYRNQTATADGDEVGGVPVWYANDGTAGPQWDPAGGTTYSPFIFGYIADPGSDWWALDPVPVAVDPDPSADPQRPDRQIYHEFRVKLFVGGNYRRDMLYRFYMTLSKDQMLDARRLHNSFSRQHKTKYSYDE